MSVYNSTALPVEHTRGYMWSNALMTLAALEKTFALQVDIKVVPDLSIDEWKKVVDDVKLIEQRELKKNTYTQISDFAIATGISSSVLTNFVQIIHWSALKILSYRGPISTRLDKNLCRIKNVTIATSIIAIAMLFTNLSVNNYRKTSVAIKRQAEEINCFCLSKIKGDSL